VALFGVATAEVSEVTLKFGVNLSSEAEIPYIANAKGGCNLDITVKCEFPKQPYQSTQETLSDRY
jgi:hypothetical protein